MNAKHYKVKEKLSEEFEWLKKNYPLSSFQHIELKVYRAEEYNAFHTDPYEAGYTTKEIDAFLLEAIHEEQLQHAIFLITNQQYELTEIDKMVLEKGGLKEEHLYYFLLYHEYGHLVHLHDTYGKKGIVGYLDEKEKMGEEIEQLILLKDKKQITEHEMQRQYRELWFEKYADDFAYEIYKLRKETYE